MILLCFHLHIQLLTPSETTQEQVQGFSNNPLADGKIRYSLFRTLLPPAFSPSRRPNFHLCKVSTTWKDAENLVI